MWMQPHEGKVESGLSILGPTSQLPTNVRGYVFDENFHGQNKVWLSTFLFQWRNARICLLAFWNSNSDMFCWKCVIKYFFLFHHLQRLSTVAPAFPSYFQCPQYCSPPTSPLKSSILQTFMNGRSFWSYKTSWIWGTLGQCIWELDGLRTLVQMCSSCWSLTWFEFLVNLATSGTFHCDLCVWTPPYPQIIIWSYGESWRLKNLSTNECTYWCHRLNTNIHRVIIQTSSSPPCQHSHCTHQSERVCLYSSPRLHNHQGFMCEVLNSLGRSIQIHLNKF